jgi:hypothetical protein
MGAQLLARVCFIAESKKWFVGVFCFESMIDSDQKRISARAPPPELRISSLKETRTKIDAVGHGQQRNQKPGSAEHGKLLQNLDFAGGVKSTVQGLNKRGHIDPHVPVSGRQAQTDRSYTPRSTKASDGSVKGSPTLVEWSICTD